MLRSAIFALVTYAFGLIPFYFLTPVHQALPALFLGAPAEIVQATPSPEPTPSPTSATTPVPRDGADTVSVVAPKSSPTVSPVPVTATVAPNDPRYGFLLLGYGGNGHDGAYLTDSMMLVIVDPIHKSLTLLSLPRDTWVPMSFNGTDEVYNKINTAYAFAMDSTLYTDRLDRYTGAHGAGTFASDTVSHLLGVPIRYYLGMDFTGFRDMIDAVGGVDVNVPDGFTARYPINDNPSINAGWTTVGFVKGEQHMNGERAIEYARARETIDNPAEGTDFARSRRQRLIMEAFKARLLEPGGLIHLPQILAIASRHVDTNYGAPGAAALSQLVLDWKSVKIYQTALTASNFLSPATGPDCTYTLTPSSANHDWGQIQQFVQRLWNTPATGEEIGNTQIVVENDTGVPGVAGQLTTILASEGYNVATPTTGTERTTTEILDRSAKGLPLLTNQLKTDLGFSDIQISSDPQTAGDYIVLELGRDNVELNGLQPRASTDPVSSDVGILEYGQWTSAPCAAPPPTARQVVSPVVVRHPRTPVGSRTPTSADATREPATVETPPPTKARGARPSPHPVKEVATPVR